ncbi:hypothetical protein G6F57_001359 [Rhizopus arrhizus]|nr:hypothetical protein G6F24_002349 [Rhizopus arrhizus]KAG0794669.1 hypothetical protein G6F21_002693 [Rhizopus arrhizus]KAG0802455.1 hypothetical protein G6F22_000248 [Rhizopus arrhizus]KAG0956444.1 hypothetical protein G6F32_002028 [Rhizopus arrhizus]KAG0968348.1 hypothetical protein G6F31_002926 [Rhizopus arrhizus]
MRTSYTTLSVPKYFDAFSLLSHRLPWYQLKDEGFYTVWSDITTYCRCCHAEGHVVWNYPKNFHLMFVGTVVLMQILLLNAQKSRNKVSQDEAQQDSSSTNAMSMVFPSTVSNDMECKRSLQNESDNAIGDN